jgi:hypothetical protein
LDMVGGRGGQASHRLKVKLPSASKSPVRAARWRLVLGGYTPANECTTSWVDTHGYGMDGYGMGGCGVGGCGVSIFCIRRRVLVLGFDTAYGIGVCGLDAAGGYAWMPCRVALLHTCRVTGAVCVTVAA